MSVAEAEPVAVVEAKPIELVPVRYNVTNRSLAEMAERLTNLPITNFAEYEVVRHGIAECRNLRGEVDRQREEYKRVILDYGRKVDGEAHRIIDAIKRI